MRNFCQAQPMARDYARFTRSRPISAERGGIAGRPPSGTGFLGDGSARANLGERIERIKIVQYLFHRQWVRLQDHCRANGVEVFGDLPIYVLHDSADVWSDRICSSWLGIVAPRPFPGFRRITSARPGSSGATRLPLVVSSPDAIRLWVRRFARHLGLFDLLRIDHFRGLVAYWEFQRPRTAVNGRWVCGGGRRFFRGAQRRLPRLALIAEDLD